MNRIILIVAVLMLAASPAYAWEVGDIYTCEDGTKGRVISVNGNTIVIDASQLEQEPSDYLKLIYELLAEKMRK